MITTSLSLSGHTLSEAGGRPSQRVQSVGSVQAYGAGPPPWTEIGIGFGLGTGIGIGSGTGSSAILRPNNSLRTSRPLASGAIMGSGAAEATIAGATRALAEVTQSTSRKSTPASSTVTGVPSTPSFSPFSPTSGQVSSYMYLASFARPEDSQWRIAGGLPAASSQYSSIVTVATPLCHCGSQSQPLSGCDHRPLPLSPMRRPMFCPYPQAPQPVSDWQHDDEQSGIGTGTGIGITVPVVGGRA